MAIYEEVYGLEHPKVAKELRNLSIVRRELGELEAARVSLARAEAIEKANGVAAE